MTVDLKLMMDLRDLQVAMEVGKKAELGWFDVEFTMYGCTYQEKGSRYYRVSAYAEKIYDFIQSSAVNGVLPTDVAILSRRCPVPTGMRETIANDVKIELAAAMARQYPTGFFDYLERIAVEVAEETALPFLQEQMQQITGCFEQTKLQRLQTLAEDACLRRKISKISYQAICSWIAEEQKNIEDSPIPKDILEKTFYAIAYQSDGKLKYVVNACKEHIYQKK